MPIEVPDTRTFGEPQRRRRRPAAGASTEATTATAAVVPAGEAEVPVAAQPTATASTPVRRRTAKPAAAAARPRSRAAAVAEAEPELVPVPEPVPAPEPEQVAVPEPEQVAVPERAAQAGGSAFSRPVRRRPKAASSEPASSEPASSGESPVARVAESTDTVPAPAVPVAVLADVTSTEEVLRTEERRGAQGVAQERAKITDTVVVRLGGTRYAVDMDAVAEVGRPPHVTRVPGVPPWVAGVANWRGRILPVIDLRVLLGAPSSELGRVGRIMVLTRDGITLGLLAERVEGVVSVELDQLEPILLTLSRTTASVLTGQLTHPDGPIAVLDLETLFSLRTQLPRVRRAG